MKKIFIVLFILINVIICNKVLAFKEYKLGDKINYKGKDYYVISYSDKNTDFITLLKEKSLTVDELNKYGRDESGKLFVNKDLINSDDPEKVIFEFEDNSGGIAYYSDDGCSYIYYYNGSSISTTESDSSMCISDYNSSDIKKVVDNWTKDNFDSNDLIEVDGYSSRILNYNDLRKNLGPISYWAGNYYLEGEKWFVDLTKEHSFWTMSKNNGNLYEIENLKSGKIESMKVFNISTVKPVINLKKCAIEDKCQEEVLEKELEKIIEEEKEPNKIIEEELDNNIEVKEPDNIIIETKVEPEKEKTIIEAENTFKTVSYILIIVGSLLIIGGYIFYKRIKKEVK